MKYSAQKKVYQKSVLTASGLKNAYFIKIYQITDRFKYYMIKIYLMLYTLQHIQSRGVVVILLGFGPGDGGSTPLGTILINFFYEIFYGKAIAYWNQYKKYA